MDTLTRRTAARGLVVALVLGLALVAGCGKNNPVAPVVLPPLRGIDVLPQDTTLAVGQSARFAAVAIDTGGAVVSGATFAWTSADAGVFTVSGQGVVVAVGEGTARLFVSAGGKVDTAFVHVTPGTRGWYAQSSGVSTKLNGVFFQPDGRRGWVVGAGGVLRATTDAGVTWALQVSNTFANLNAVWFTTSSEGWVAGDNGTLLHTTDSGATWSARLLAAGQPLYGIWFATPDTGWVVGGAGTVLRTVDRGATWTQSAPTLSALRGVSFAGTRYGWAVGDNGAIVGTVDRGLNWTVLTPTVTALDLKAVWRTSVLRANAVGAAGAAPVCADDGLGNPQWTLVNPGASYAFEGVCFVDALEGWAVGLNGTAFVLHSGDGGQTWTPQTVSDTYRLNHVMFVDAGHGWAVGDNGQILHTATGGQP